MKLRTFPSIILVLTLASCSVSETDSFIEPIRQISFMVTNYQSETRSDNVMEYDTDVPFGTYGWFYNEGQGYKVDPSKAQPFMVDEKVSHFDAGSTAACQWLPATTYYWPKSGSVDFISYSPASASDNIIVSQDRICFSGYTIDQTRNLMYADKAVGMSKNLGTYSHSGVPTLFHHALAQLNFTVRQSIFTDEPAGKTDQDGYTTWTIAVSQIRISDLVGDGSMELTLSENQTCWDLPEVEKGEPAKSYHIWNPGGLKDAKTWSNLTEVTKYKGGEAEDGYTILGQELTAGYVPFHNGKTGKDLVTASNYLVIPQYLDTQKITVTYSIITREPDGNVFVQDDIQSSCLAYVEGIKAFDAWEMNKNITYELTINPVNSMDPITFDPAVQSWDALDSSTSINY